VDRGTVKRIRGLGFLADPNDLAQAFVSAIPLVFLAWRPSRHFVNLAVVLPSAAALIWGILLSRSRGALVALAALFVAAVLYRLRPRYRRPATLAVLVLSIPAFIGLFGYAKADESAASRLEAWSGGLMMLKASPIWGVGMGLFVDHHERVAHNSYVQCFAETGLVGYFLWLGLIVVILERLSALSLTSPNTDWSRWARGARLALFGFLFAALFLSRTATPMFFFLTALPVALLGIAQREGQRVETPRLWWLHTLLVEAGSIIIVWITARAFH
jgi:O-antigen ligase